MTPARPIVVFDGDCGLCNGFVAWLIRHDPDGRYLIAGSGGQVGQQALRSMGLPATIADSTLVLATSDGPMLKSAAVAGIGRGLGWPWRAAAALRIVPGSWRDGLYDQIARRRRRGRAEDPACGVPPVELAAAWRAQLATTDDVAALMRSSPRRGQGS